MQKKVFSLMMGLILAFTGLARANELTVNDGTTTNALVPVYGLYADAYLKCEYILPASQLTAMSGGTISQMTFYLQTPASGSWGAANFRVFLKEVTFESLSNYTGYADATVVYQGQLDGTQPTMEVTFTAPYTYNGGNLLVGFYNETIGTYKSASFYGDNAYDGDCIQGYSYSSLSAITVNHRNFLPKTTFTYTGGAPQPALLSVNPDPVDLGARPNNCWMRPMVANVLNAGPATTIYGVDVDNAYFVPSLADEEMAIPFALGRGEDFDISFGWTSAPEGQVNGQLVIDCQSGRSALLYDLTAYAYEPVKPDVWEMARVINAAYPFEYRNTATEGVTLYDNYLLPGNAQDGPDAVYKVTFNQDVMLNGTVTVVGSDEMAENGKMAVYTQAGIDEVGGPDLANSYVGPTIGGGSEPYDLILGEGTGTSSYQPYYTLYNNSLSQQLYQASMLQEAGMGAGVINTIGYYTQTTFTYTIGNVKIYMANVANTEVPSTSMPASAMTLVYEGSNLNAVVGWNDFELNGNFAWDGSSNLLVMFQRNCTEWHSGPSWQYTAQSYYAGAYDYDDNIAFNPQTATYGLTTTTYLPNTHFVGGGRNRDGNVLTYNFDDGTLQGWTAIDANNDGYNWFASSSYSSNSGSYAAVSQSYRTAISPDNYLVSPQVTLGEGASISFYEASYYGYEEPIYLMVSTTGTNPSDFTSIQNWTFSNDHQYGFEQQTVDLSAYAGQQVYLAFRHYGSYDQYNILIDDITIDLGGTPGPVPPTPEIEYIIENMTMVPGTYYIAASSTQDAWDVVLNATELPCPEMAYNPSPADDADELEPAAVNLTWTLGQYTTEYRLVFGSTYYCEDILVDWTTDLAQSYTVRNLYNNTNYFWRVDERNGNCETYGQVWGFTTHLNVPQNLRVADETIFEGQSAVLSWNAIQDRTYRYYNIYQDNELIASTPANVVTTTYTVEGLTYNMDGYSFFVTAVYDEGESAPSNEVNVKVSGNGSVAGHVYEQDSITGIANATVTFTGVDEFGDNQTFSFITDATGAYGGAIMAGEFNGMAACEGYQTITEPVQGNPVAIGYANTTTPIDFVMDENFDPVCEVIAQYYPDSLNPASPYVKVYWGCGLPGSSMIEDFETGDFSQFDYNFPSNYPWEIVTTHPYEGTYCMKSGGTNIASASSSVEVTVEIPRDGLFSFYSYISCESSWDNGYYYMDGTQMGSVTGLGATWVIKEFAVTAGTHTFKWTYTKDSSVNSGEDAWFVDYIDFIHSPEPPIPGETYTFDDGTMQGWTTIDADGDGRNFMVASTLMSGVAGHNGSADFVFSQSYDNSSGIVYPDNYLVSPQVELGGIVKFYACAQDAGYAAEHFGVAVSTTGNTNAADFTTVQEWTLSAKKDGMPKRLRNDGSRDSRDQGNWYEYTVDLSAYSGMGYVAIRHFNCSDQFYLDVDDITIGEPGRAAANDRAFSHYRVYRTSCYNDGPYTEENTVVLACELQDTLYIDVDWPDVEPGVYKWGVGVVYAGNRESAITWSEPTMVPGEAETATRDEMTYDFEDGTMQGWTTIDADGDGYNWIVASSFLSGVAGHNGSADFVLSQSYDNNYGVLYPDNYLVSPQIQLGGSISFWACGQDAYYPAEHFGVAVSTTGNTNASDFTTIYEATIGAKGTRYDGPRGTRDQSTWTQYTVDLSAYSGMGYVALRHFNCYDEFYLDVDDVVITTGTPGPTPGPTPGGNPIQEPRESEIVWSNCLDKDMYLDGDVTINVLLNSADNPEGVNVVFTNLNAAEQELYPIDPIIIDETGFYAFDSFRKGDYVIDITFDGYEPITDTVEIWDATSMRYVMTEIIYPVGGLYVSSTGWAMWDGETPGPVPPTPGDTEFTEGFEGGLNGWNVLNASGEGSWIHSDDNLGGYDYTVLAHTGTGFAMGYSFVDYVGAVNIDSYLYTAQKYSITSTSTLTFWADNANDSYPESFSVCVATADNPTAADFTQVWSGGAKAGNAGKAAVRHDENRYENWRQHTIDLSAYAGQNVYIAFHDVNYDMYEIWIDDVELSAGRNGGDRHLEGYKVMCTSIDDQPIFNADTEHPFCQVNTDELVEGEHYKCKVAAIYSTGMSEWRECEWAYIPCENYAGTTEGVIEEEPAGGNHFSWTYPTGPGPVPPGPGDEWSYSFDNGFDGWTTIDADGDGHNWYHSTEAGNHGTAAVTSHSGAGHLMSESYCNATYAALSPDEYVVSPASAITNGSTFSFWVCAQDASYAAEHYGVAVSTDGTTFTTIQEWTLTAKGGNAVNPAATRNGKGTREGNWYQKTVDLSDYAGQTIYIAVRHFNCTDQFILLLDDAELSIGAKNGNNRDVIFNGFVTDPGAMANGADASWIKGSQSTWGPNVNNGGGYMLGDSFTLDAATTISEIEVYGYQTGSTTTSTFTGLYAQIYNGNPMNGGTAIWGDMSTNLMTATAFTNCYRGSDGETTATTRPIMSITASNLNISLDAGTYYLVYSLAGTGSSGPWGAPHAEPGVGNTGAGVQYTTSWVALADSGSGETYGCAMKITTGSSPVPPTPGDNTVIGAMIFRDGEWLAQVDYPTNEYIDTDEYGHHVYCVRLIYAGTNFLPEGNIYYSMSCEECIEIGDGSCPAGADIRGEYVWNEGGAFGALISWGEQVPPITPVEEWLYYDDGTYASSIGTGSPSPCYWGIMIPATALNAYAGCSLTQVAMFDAYAATYTCNIYYGGNTPNGGTLVHTQNLTGTGSVDWVYANLTSALPIDATQNLWITFYCNTLEYPMAGSNDTGDANGRWVSLDGSTWEDIAGYNLNYTWMIRGFVTNQAKGGSIVALDPFQGGASEGTLKAIAGSSNVEFDFSNRAAQIVKYNVYRSTSNANYELIGSVNAVAGQDYYEYFDEIAAGTYYYQVTAVYDNECESDPALAENDHANDYVIVTVTGIEENSGIALYPNPTSGNVKIEAVGMNHITVVSALGQVVYDAEVSCDEYELNMAQFNAGIYMVRISSESGVSTQRVTVVR